MGLGGDTLQRDIFFRDLIQHCIYQLALGNPINAQNNGPEGPVTSGCRFSGMEGTELDATVEWDEGTRPLGVRLGTCLSLFASPQDGENKSKNQYPKGKTCPKPLCFLALARNPTEAPNSLKTPKFAAF